MMSDKRKGPRRPLRYTAWISLGPKELHGCVVADISDFGARLEVESTDGISDHFVLLLSARGKPKRKCRVVWREANYIGVEFERPLAAAEKNRPILKTEKQAPPLSPMSPPEADAELVDIEGKTEAEPA